MISASINTGVLQDGRGAGGGGAAREGRGAGGGSAAREKVGAGALRDMRREGWSVAGLGCVGHWS